jgi:hypothetical protein
MAESAILTFALPEDVESNRLLIYSSPTRDGTYTLVANVQYDYGMAQHELDELDTGLWYRIQFLNTRDNEAGPISDPVYGGTFGAGAPFLAISSMFDGAAYATSEDLYQYAGLQPSDVSPSRASAALKRARAWIDWRTSEMGIDRLEQFDTDVARRKFNASLRIIKEAEICLALSHLYTSMSDDLIVASMRGGEGSAAAGGSVSIGNTSISGDAVGERSESILYLSTLAARYADEGEKLLSSLDTNSVRLVGYDMRVRVPRFRLPFNGY